MHETLQDLQPVVPLPDLVPEIGDCIVSVPGGPWVARPTRFAWPVGADVERQELGVPPPKPSGYKCPVGINCKVDEGALGEEQIIQVPVAVLGNSVVGVLPGVRIL